MNELRQPTILQKLPGAEYLGAQHKVLGLFSGIGGMEKGLGKAEHTASMLCEIWQPAVDVLKGAFPDVPLVADVSNLAHSTSSIPGDVTLLTAGFPCTDLSQAGMMEGLAGKRSGLIYQVFRILDHRAKAKAPIPWVVLENVPNMLYLKRGRAMDVIVTQLEEMGYKWAYRVVDSRAFGVPQRRRRVFLVASVDGDPRDVLLSDDVGNRPEPPRSEWSGTTSVGFYWTEGLRGVGWAEQCVPTLKGGSTVGVSSPPAILLPEDRGVVTPHIRDAERLQGFAPGWTEAAAKDHKEGFRWKLVGNAVTVQVAKWLGERLARPCTYDDLGDTEFLQGSKWPKSAYCVDGQRMVANVSEYPMAMPWEPIDSFLQHETSPLSGRAIRGFLSRARSEKCNLRWPPGFLERLDEHERRMSKVS